MFLTGVLGNVLQTEGLACGNPRCDSSVEGEGGRRKVGAVWGRQHGWEKLGPTLVRVKLAG